MGLAPDWAGTGAWPIRSQVLHSSLANFSNLQLAVAYLYYWEINLWALEKPLLHKKYCIVSPFNTYLIRVDYKSDLSFHLTALHDAEIRRYFIFVFYLECNFSDRSCSTDLFDLKFQLFRFLLFRRFIPHQNKRVTQYYLINILCHH